MNGRRRASRPSRLSLLAAAALCLGAGPPTGEAGDFLETHREAGRPGGRLVVALRAEPRTLNPLSAIDHPSLTVVRRLTADLIHVDRSTQRTVPGVARSWTRSPDGRTFEVELRRGIRFSDGHPLDADDVLFSFAAYLDEEVASPYRGQLVIGGEPIAVRKAGPHSVVFELAQPDAWGERLFNDLAILPRHKLAPELAAGRLGEAWGIATPPGEIAGLGPYRLARYVPGQRLELERNPHYWKVDSEGRRLPYLDTLTFLFVASEDAQALRFQAGETHLIDRLSAGNFALLEREQERRRQLLRDLGPGLGYEFLFFNLNDLGGRGLGEIERKQRWFRRLAFRRAVSSAIDRDAIVRLVYRGRATPIASYVSPGNKLWADPALAAQKRSLEASRELLREAGFTWDGDGRLVDPDGGEVELSIIASASNGERLAIGGVLQADLDRLGLTVRIVPLEFRALLERVQKTFEYEACLLGLGAGDGDPNSGLGVWRSNGGNHFWHLGQERPATPWEAVIDRLLERQMTTLEPRRRKRLNDRVQRLVADHLPFVFLVSPNVLVGARRDLGNFTPAVLEHYTLWNVEELFWSQDTSPGAR